MPFNGVNPHSIIILDNCSIYHIEGIALMIEEVGALVHFLPPYSSDFNPIEKTFSKVKENLEDSMADVLGIETILLSAFTTVTPEDTIIYTVNVLFSYLVQFP